MNSALAAATPPFAAWRVWYDERLRCNSLNLRFRSVRREPAFAAVTVAAGTGSILLPMSEKPPAANICSVPCGREGGSAEVCGCGSEAEPCGAPTGCVPG